MCELGLAHALRPATEFVVVRSDTEQINFDLAGIKIQAYDRNDLAAARVTFGQLLNDRLADLDQTRHLKTTQAVESLDGDCLTLLANAGNQDYFAVKPATNMSEVMAQISQGTKDAVRHLLALGMIRFDVNKSVDAYAYHWTDFGLAVLGRMGIR
jgi:hypothetical protein